MEIENTQTTSLGEKKKKFKMPKFPSALVILFCVLLFVMILSWIPHKGWVDTGNPLIFFDETGLWIPNDPHNILLGTWVDPDWDQVWSEGNASLQLSLNKDGIEYLTMLLTYNTKLPLEKWDGLVTGSLTDGGLLITFSNINLGSDWNKVAINYSNISFNASVTLEENVYSSAIIFDKVYSPSIMQESAQNNIEFTFNILSGTVSSLDGAPFKNEDFELVFASENIAGNWFNFWNTNYYVGDTAGRYGILNLPFLLIAGVINTANLIFFILCIGAFIKVMLESGALEAGTVSLINKLKGKELLLVPMLYMLCATVGTVAGMQSSMLALIPLIVPFLVLAGFDTMTGLIVVVVGNTSGIAASVLDVFTVGVMSGTLSVDAAPTISIGWGIGVRIVTFIALLVVGSLFATWYGNRSRKGKDYCLEPEKFEENEQWANEMLGESRETHTGLTRRQAIGLGIFAATFLVMLLALLPWTDWFEGLQTAGWWQGISSLFFAKILLGDWYFVQLAFLFLVSAFILGKVFGMKQKQTNKAVVKGAKGMIGICMILSLTRSISLVLTYSGLITAMIAMMFSGASGGGFSIMGLTWILFPMFVFLAVFVPSQSGLSGIIGPLVGPILWQLSQAYSNPEDAFKVFVILVMSTCTLAIGLINMCIPTSGYLVAQTEIARVNFIKAFKILGICALGTAIISMTIITASVPILTSGLELA